MKLLADRLVELEVVVSIDPATVWGTLQKRPQAVVKQQRVIPPKAGGAFVAAREGVIEVYHRPPDPDRPVVCVDEGGKQFIGDVREPLPVRPGSPAMEDAEYGRHGTANLFLAFEPLAGRRAVEVTARRAAVDFARLLRHLLDVVCRRVGTRYEKLAASYLAVVRVACIREWLKTLTAGLSDTP